MIKRKKSERNSTKNIGNNYNDLDFIFIEYPSQLIIKIKLHSRAHRIINEMISNMLQKKQESYSKINVKLIDI